MVLVKLCSLFVCICAFRAAGGARPSPVYSNEYAVHIPDGKGTADQIASKHGFVNRGQIPEGDEEAARVGNSFVSFVPILIFLVGAFALVYRIFHRRTTRLTRTKIWLYRELGFHWTYFYLVRIWFLVIKGYRYSSSALADFVKVSKINENLVFNSTFLNGVLLFSLFTLSSIPLVIFVVKVWMKENIPDFFLWVGQDPWLRSEIGLAGHYLDRPPMFPTPKRREYAYRSKRSTSTEENAPRETILRHCKSVEDLRCVRSMEVF